MQLEPIIPLIFTNYPYEIRTKNYQLIRDTYKTKKFNSILSNHKQTSKINDFRGF